MDTAGPAPHGFAGVVVNPIPPIVDWGQAVLIPTSQSFMYYYPEKGNPPPPSSTCNRTPKEGQCGGKAWTGETCCPDGYKCTPQNEWYSQYLVK